MGSYSLAAGCAECSLNAFITVGGLALTLLHFRHFTFRNTHFKSPLKTINFVQIPGKAINLYDVSYFSSADSEGIP